MTMKKGFASKVHGKADGLFDAAGTIMGKAVTDLEAAFSAFQALAKNKIPEFLVEGPKAVAATVKKVASMLGIPFATAAEDRTPEEQVRLARASRQAKKPGGVPWHLKPA